MYVLMFCTIIVSLFVAKVLGKHFQSSSYLVLVFFKENLHSLRKFTERLFLLQLLYTKFFGLVISQNSYFSEQNL